MALAQRAECRCELAVACSDRRERGQHLVLGIGHRVIQVGHTAALGRAALAEGEKTAEAAVGGAVAGIAEEREAGGEIEPRAGQEPQALHLRRHMGAHRAGERVAVGGSGSARRPPRGPATGVQRCRPCVGAARVGSGSRSPRLRPFTCSGTAPCRGPASASGAAA